MLLWNGVEDHSEAGNRDTLQEMVDAVGTKARGDIVAPPSLNWSEKSREIGQKSPLHAENAQVGPCPDRCGLWRLRKGAFLPDPKKLRDRCSFMRAALFLTEHPRPLDKSGFGDYVFCRAIKFHSGQTIAPVIRPVQSPIEKSAPNAQLPLAFACRRFRIGVIMGISKKRPLLLEILEDRRVLSGFSALPLAPLLADASPGIVEETLPALGVEADLGTRALGIEARLEASVATSPSLGASLGAEAFLNIASEPVLGLAKDLNVNLAQDSLAASLTLEGQVFGAADLTGPIDGSVRADIVIGDGIRGDAAGEVIIGPGTVIDLGGSVRIENPLAPLPELPLPESPLPELSEDPVSVIPPSDVDFVPPVFADDVPTFTGQDASSTVAAIDGQLGRTEAGFLVSDEELAAVEELAKEGMLAEDEDALADGWRLSAEEEQALLELANGFLLATRSGHVGAVDNGEQPGVGEIGLGLAADESLLHGQGEDFAFMGGALDAFSQNVLGAFEAFKSWLARIGPVPWVVMGLAFGLACFEAAERQRRKDVRLREEEAAGV